VIPGQIVLSVGRTEMPAPSGWVWTKLTEVARLETGHTPSREHPEYWDGDIPWIGIKDARLAHGSVIQETFQKVTQLGLENSAARLLPAGTVCLSRTASVGYAFVMGRDMATSQDFVNWVCSPALLPKFLMYALLAEKDSLHRFGKGTTHTTIYVPEVKAFHICLPPVEEQWRIVERLEELLSDLDAGVSTLERARANLKRYRAAILRAAVTGELTADWRAAHPNVEPATKLLDRILAERRRKLEAKFVAVGKAASKNRHEKSYESAYSNVIGLPELPSGWCWSSLGQCFDVCVGATPSRPEARFWNGRIPWVSSGQVQFNRIKEPKEYITQAGLDNTSTQLNPKGSVLLGMIGEGKTRGQVSILDIEACNNQNCAAIWVSKTPIPPEYVFYWLWSRYEETRRGSAGNNQPALNRTRVEAIPLPLPPLLEQEAIVSEVEQRISVVTAAENYIAANLKRASRLRQSILKEAFAGRLVPQDPKDEPAAVLLERIRGAASGPSSNGVARTRRRKDQP
jgi:type I restriction enzyme S subunit